MHYSLEVCDAFNAALQRLRTEASQRPILIGVDGRAGSGKTIFSHLLAAHLGRIGGRAVRLRYDTFWVAGQEYQSLLAAMPELAVSRRQPGDYDYAWQHCRDRLLAGLRKGLRAGMAADPGLETLLAACRADAAATNSYAGDPHAADWVILEGTTCLRRELRPSYDLSLLLRLDPQTCLRQLLAREQGVGAEYFLKVWMPLEARYFEEHQPEAAADFVIDTLPARSAFSLKSAVSAAG